MSTEKTTNDLLTECISLRAEVTALRVRNTQLITDYNNHSQRLANAEAECKQLTEKLYALKEENAQLKESQISTELRAAQMVASAGIVHESTKNGEGEQKAAAKTLTERVLAIKAAEKSGETTTTKQTN